MRHPVLWNPGSNNRSLTLKFENWMTKMNKNEDAKDQLISEGNLSVFKSPKKWTKIKALYYVK